MTAPIIMMYEAEHDLDEELRDVDRAAPVVGALPAALVMSQRAAAALRAYVSDAKLNHYRLFHCPSHDLYDVERCLEDLGEDAAAWEAMPALIRDGESISTITHDEERSKLWDGGVLRLAKHEVVLARWYWVDIDNYNSVRVMWLAAAPSAKAFHELREAVQRHRRANAASVWQIVRGYASSDGPRKNRTAPDDLLLPDALRQRAENELIRFFSEEVAALYRALKVPYRRGVLLHGPPGNGKTSLIRHVAFSLPHVPAMLLRPSANFDSDDLEEVVRRWTAHAPAILVIEDLNWLLKQVNVSTFLNLLDGVDTDLSGGLLLIATSNHPQELDPAINNRPGRFDVVIEVPCPDRSLRLAFLQRKLSGEISLPTLERVASDTDGISFAHLQEILRLSGLCAIHNGRSARSDDDLSSAAQTVTQAYGAAARGFPPQTEMPFGLLPLRDRRK